MIADPHHSRLGRSLGRIPTDLRLFVAMMAFLVPVRIASTAQIDGMWVDGGYYLDVAQHVRDGDGVASNVSLYHFGYPTFPYPTSVYPLWPWLLGMGGRWVDITVLAHWLPLGFSLLAVVAAFGFGRRLWPEPLLPVHVPGLHAGHVFALGIAVQSEFVYFSSLPYTEPLAWALLFLFCWRVVAKGPDLGVVWAVETGCWLGLLYLARFQLLVAPLAMAGAWAIRFVLGPGRGRIAAHAALALGVTGLFVGGWYLHLQTFVAHPGLSSLLRFDQNRANDLLSEIDIIVDTPGFVSLLLDRARGFVVGWDPASESSYTTSFYTMHWALPLALPFLLVAAVRAVRRDGWVERLRRPEVAHWYFVLLFALGALLSVHVIHKHYNGSWYFSSRQGLMSLPAFLLPMVWLLRQTRPLAMVFGVVVLSSTAVFGGYTVWTTAVEPPEELRTDAHFDDLVRWLERHTDAEGHVVVALDSAQVQRVAWQTRGVGYHWIQAATPYEDYLTMCDQLGARYVIVRKRALDRRWKLLVDRERLNRDFVRLREEPDGHVIFERKR